jgi:hypothetical protein
MKPSAKKVSSQQFLSGWKDIASYLGKGVRTVQRYERDLALPVREKSARRAHTSKSLLPTVQSPPSHFPMLQKAQMEYRVRGSTSLKERCARRKESVVATGKRRS